jgi:hypothetical protein
MATPLPRYVTRLTDLDQARAIAAPGARLAAMRRAAQSLRARILASGPAVSVTTFDVSSLPYPSRYGLSGAARGLAPFVLIRNRMQLIQVEAGDTTINILLNPTDPSRAEAAPFIDKQLRQYGRLADVVKARLVHGDLLSSLRSVGLAAEDIDYILFDHLHVQDVRGLLGTETPEPGQSQPTPALLPNARLLAQPEELAVFDCLHPQQRYWYVADGIAGIAGHKLLAIAGDYLIGGGFAVVHTPGHTRGNQTGVIHTDTGLWTVSENGIAAECYAPQHSEIPGLRRYAGHHELEVVLNGNTREDSLEQYTSMILEKTLADPSQVRPEFPQHFPSSELEASALTPGLRPTFCHGRITHGTVRPRPGSVHRAPGRPGDVGPAAQDGM